MVLLSVSLFWLWIYYIYCMREYLSKGENFVSGRLGRIYGSFFIELNVGYRGETLFEIIDQELDYTYTSTNYFNIFNSGSVIILRDTNVIINGKKYQGLDIYDKVYFMEENIENKMTFKFINVTFDKFIEHGAYGLGLSISDKNQSFIHQLYDNKRIDSLSYSIIPQPFTIPGRVYFGGIPKKIISEAIAGKCKVSSHSKWGCRLVYVSFDKNNIVFYNQFAAYFQAKESGIKAPKDFLVLIRNKILHEYLITNLCQVIVNKSLAQYRCNVSVLEKLPMLSFAFDSTIITIPFQEFFTQINKSSADLEIQENLDNNQWVLGSIFLNQIATLFDYESKTITFYSNHRIKVLNSYDSLHKKSVILYLYWLILVTLVIGIAYQYISKRKMHIYM